MKEEEEYRKRKEALDLISEKQAARQREIEAKEEKARKEAREIERAPKERDDNKYEQDKFNILVALTAHPETVLTLSTIHNYK